MSQESTRFQSPGQFVLSNGEMSTPFIRKVNRVFRESSKCKSKSALLLWNLPRPSGQSGRGELPGINSASALRQPGENRTAKNREDGPQMAEDQRWRVSGFKLALMYKPMRWRTTSTAIFFIASFIPSLEYQAGLERAS
jgi:hypothetical protein